MGRLSHSPRCRPLAERLDASGRYAHSRIGLSAMEWLTDAVCLELSTATARHRGDTHTVYHRRQMPLEKPER